MAEAKGSYVGGTPVYFKDEKARAMLSNEYVPAENYAAGNLCIHEGKLYKATKATTGTWDATAWTETNLAEVNAGMQKSITDLTEKTTITPTPITGLEFTPATSFVKGGVAYLNCQLSNKTTAAIDMINGKVLANGFPVPYKKQQVYTEAIPWNNGFTGSDARTIPLRLCINANGQLCSFFPSTKEKINVGMPICINMSYPVED